jgi:hypothetical protein
VLGTFQPCKIDGTEDGPPITGYFPRVIDDNMFHAVATGLKDRRKRPGRVSERIELFSGLLRNARDHDTYYATTRNDRSGLKYRVLINTKSANGSVKCYSFPSQTFEECILASLREVDPLQILASADTPDETLALAGELATIEAKIAALEAELLNGDVAALARVLRVLEEKKRDIAAKLAEARGRAASPLSESWGECKSILETLASAPDVKDARLRLRGVLRRIITDIWLMVVPRGILRTCAVQVFFAEGGRRDYWLLHRGRHNGRQERFVSLSVREGSILDLRTADGADKMRQQLESLTKDQINSLIAHGAELA